jgi:hypothetical protein
MNRAERLFALMDVARAPMRFSDGRNSNWQSLPPETPHL